jgi:hypothetical protein
MTLAPASQPKLVRFVKNLPNARSDYNNWFVGTHQIAGVRARLA